MTRREDEDNWGGGVIVYTKQKFGFQMCVTSKYFPESANLIWWSNT